MRGLSVRDVEAALAEALGSDATVSKSTVSRVCEAIKEESDAFRARDLSGIELDYLFLDGSHFRMHPGGPAEPVLVAWGFNTPPASSSSWGLEPGNAESTDAWAGFPAGLLGRGLRSPLLVVSDGGAGLDRATRIDPRGCRTCRVGGSMEPAPVGSFTPNLGRNRSTGLRPQEI